MPVFQDFSVALGDDGKVRSYVWDRVCVPGTDWKDEQSTEFSLETLSQMVDNFVERGDPLPIDYNHQSSYTQINGQPAPALGFYGALAVVIGGELKQLGTARGVSISSTEGLDLSKDGLWAYRSEVTPLGQDLLPNFRLLSPTFLPESTKRDGTPAGYMLCAVAATNTPWQSGTSITFEKAVDMEQYKKGDRLILTDGGSATVVSDNGGSNLVVEIDGYVGNKSISRQAIRSKRQMESPAPKSFDAGPSTMAAAAAKGGAMSPEMMSKLGLSEGSSPEEKEKAFAKYFAECEEKMAKYEAPPPAEMEADKEEEKKMEADKEEKDAKMAVMSATLKATQDKLAKLEAKELAREEVAAKEAEAKFAALADEAIAGGYPKESREALIKFARVDFDGAKASVSHLLPKVTQAHLFDRVTRGGTPGGAPRGLENAPSASGVVKMGRGLATAIMEYRKANPKASYEEAAVKVARENPALAESYFNGQ